MKRTILKAGAVAGAVSVAVLAAGPAMAAAVVSQASAQSLNLTVGGTPAVSQKITATNDGTTQTSNATSANTVPQLADLLPANTVAQAGVAAQNAFAWPNGTSSACSALAGSGPGIVQTGSAPCTPAPTPVGLNLTNTNLGTVLNNNGALAPLTTALQPVYGTLSGSALTPITNALAAVPVNAQVGLSGVGAFCEAHPGGATGGISTVDLSVNLTVGATTLKVIDLKADGSPNQKLVGDLKGSTTMITNAVSAALLSALTTSTGSPVGAGSPLSALGGALAPAASALTALTTALGGAVPTVQNSILDPVATALTPLTSALSQNVLEVTFNKQPVPQAPGTFDTTALDLQVLPAAATAIGASLISGDIAHVICGPNTAANVVNHVTPPATNKAPNVPKAIDSGKTGGSDMATVIAAMSVLLAAGGAAGAGAYRRYWMPRG